MKITVFTPTYNRGYIIKTLYESLKQQTYRDFEWVIIDDGSTDDTEQIFSEISAVKQFFDIVYIKKENGGKHRAINQGVKLAKGELFFIVDSDDYITEDALEKLIKWENNLPENDEFCGISGLRGKNNKEFWGNTFPGEFCDAYYHERDNYNIIGDKAEAFYTNILKQYPFVEFDNENFITEATVWLEMGAKHKIRYYNEIIYICDYLPDGLSHNSSKIVLKNPKGHAYYIKQLIKFAGFSFKQKMSAYYYYGKDFKTVIPKDKILKNLEITSFEFWLANILLGTLIKFRNLLK